MKVSVLVITYNQQRYISEAINSILMQQVKFDYEIVVGDDASTDQTQAILLDFQTRYPDKIRLLLRDKSEAEHDRARGLPGKTNHAKTLQACRGDYVALLDGDDYWTSPFKLQKQVELLDRRPDCAMSCHPVVIIRDGYDNEPELVLGATQNETFTLEEFLAGKCFVAAVSVVFRRGLFEDLPPWFYNLVIGDWSLNVLNLEHGNIAVINEVLAAYRKHSGGMWTGAEGSEKENLEYIKFYKAVNRHLNFRYDKIIAVKIFMCRVALVAYFCRKGDYASARAHGLKCLRSRPIHKQLLLKLKVFLRLYVPPIYRISKKAHHYFPGSVSSS
ncbi:MAG: glycosyltransferase [bacterium]